MLLRADCIRCGGCWGVLLPDRESSGRLDVVPVLLSEGIGLLLETLLALRETLVLADSHGCDVWAFLLVRFDEGREFEKVDFPGGKCEGRKRECAQTIS